MFPFNQPPASAFYLTLYLGTFVLHVLPMAYVVAGSAVLLLRTLAGAKPPADPLVEHFRQWLPFMLSVAITAGVAPLLFLQILYQREFYTANLLLFNRWMAILPVLIVGFYLLYLVKGSYLWERWWLVRVLVAAIVLGCFAFIGWSWTENHLLSTAGQEVWTRHYAAGRTIHSTSELWPRLGIWLAGVFPVMAAQVAWPLAQQSLPPGTARRLATIALAGLIVSLACIGWYVGKLDNATREHLVSAPFRLNHVGFVVGVALQLIAWTLIWGNDRLLLPARWLALAGVILGVACVAVCREAIRTSRLDMAALLPRHQAAADVGGFWLFALFVMLNAAAIGGCVYLVAKYARPNAPT
jgi:hypothetical protein